MEISIYQPKHSFGVIFQIISQSKVVIRLQFFDYTVYHARAKHIIFLKDSPLLLQTFCRSCTTVG